MTFDEEPSSVATELPDLAVYKPSQFFTTALCQSKVCMHAFCPYSVTKHI